MTPEEIKSKYGSCYTLEIPDGDTTTRIHLRPIDRQTYSAASKLIAKDELQGAEMIIRTLWCGGDDVNLVIGDFENLRAAANVLASMLISKEAVLKKN
jgi:hypothetical protein